MAPRKSNIDFIAAPLDDLKKHLKKKKAEEALIELALSLRDNPELEDKLARITACVAELRVTERAARLEEATMESSEDTEAQKQVLEKQKAGLEQRVEKASKAEGGAQQKLLKVYKRSLDEVVTKLSMVGMSKKLIRFKEHFEKVQSQLVELVREWEADETLKEFQLEEHVPGVTEYARN